MTGSMVRYRRWPYRHFLWTAILLAMSLVACQAPQPAPEIKIAVKPTEPSTKIGTATSLSVLGLGPRDLEKLLGMPKLVRRDAPAEVWQYRSEVCVLDVFIYQVAAGPQVKYAEARTMAAEPARTDDCVNTIREQNSPERFPT